MRTLRTLAAVAIFLVVYGIGWASGYRRGRQMTVKAGPLAVTVVQDGGAKLRVTTCVEGGS